MTGATLALLALLVVVGSGVFWFRLASRLALPKDRRGFLALWLVGLALGIAALGQGAGGIGTAAAIAAVVGAGFFLFTVSISRQVVGAEAITVGAKLPEVTAPDENGEPFSLASLAGGPVLLKFFRGHW